MPDPAHTIARLIAGRPVRPDELAALPDTWGALARAMQSANGKGPSEALEAFLLGCPNAAELRAAIMAADPDSPEEPEAEEEPLPLFANVPELPEGARLPDTLMAEAEGAGRWLTQYQSFASLASPMTPGEFHEILGLTILSAATARRVCLRVSSHSIYPNLYALLVAPSTLFRKTTGLRIAEGTLEAAGLRRLILPSRLTPESLMTELTGRKPRNYDDWEKTDKDDWQAERQFAAQRFWAVEEASGLLDSFDRQYSAGLLPLVLDLWDCPEVRTVFTLGNGRQTVRRAYLTICGATTPAALKPHLSNPAHWGNGLWARFILLTPTARAAWKFWPEAADIPQALTSPLKTLALEKLPLPKSDNWGGHEPPQPLTASLAPDVWEHWEAYARALEFELLAREGFSPRLNPSYGRLATLAIKVATLLAAIDWAMGGKSASLVIGLRHWARAQLITEHWRASLHRLIELPDHEGRGDDLDARILHLLRNAPNGLTSREIAQALSMTRASERAEVNATLDLLKRDGLIEEFERKGKRGPPAKACRVVKPKP
jgi:hypothetical protein